MGVRGLWEELAPAGKKQSLLLSHGNKLMAGLSKLALEKWEQTGEPVKIAIDFSIWLYPAQSGQRRLEPCVEGFVLPPLPTFEAESSTCIRF